MRSRLSLIYIGVLTTSLILPAGCRRPEVQIYDTPKDTSERARPLAELSAPSDIADALTWSPHAGWKELPPTQFRKGNYLYNDEAGAVEITVTSFPGSTGGLLANVNRWLGQASLPAVDASQLQKMTSEMSLSSGASATIVDLKPSGETEDSTSIYAAIIPFMGQSWFFKMSGPRSTLESQIEPFRTMIEAIEFGGPAAAATSEAPGTEDASHLGDLVFSTPQGWTVSEGNSMRIASLAIIKEGFPAADFSITSFPGDTGGLVANVNRWRRQIGLADWNASQVEAAATRMTNPSGLEFTMFELKSDSENDGNADKETILVAIMEMEGRSWFFKLRGDALLLDIQMDKFKYLLQSVRFSHEGHNH
ncbi:hypothetical protein [Pelagicoccus albus]|uniref:Uncharacterized protein n=1 Tax=Pelagicoccus albus TaxID=415222 RepID=A0A7X1E7N4_9BACT|nr:hypothetical protein [Pelagicoccus albus]MBC2605376.1 hypothetical protein [Pelagicoccus albus]